MELKEIKRLKEINDKLLFISYKKTKRISNLRLLVFGLIALFFVLTFTMFNFFYLSMLILTILIFTLLVIYNEKLMNEKLHLSYIESVINSYFDRTDNKWIDFSDGGEEYLTDEYLTLADLDIIGSTSLFKYLNVSKTKGGRQLFFDYLNGGALTEKQIEDTRKSVMEISTNVEFSLNFQANLRDFADQSRTKDLRSIVDTLKIRPKVSIIWKIFSIIIPVITLTIITLTILSVIPYGYLIFNIVYNLVFSGTVYIYFKKNFDKIGNISISLTLLNKIYLRISNTEFKTKNLLNNQENLTKALLALKTAKSLHTYDSLMQNSVSYLILNAVLPLNLIVIFKYLKFSKNNLDIIEESISSLEIFEVYTSLAILPQMKENICEPVLSSKTEISFSDLKHPLLSEEVCIPNSLKALDSVNVITGSNMSGKTSFLRTMGINLVLMNAGCVVNARSFRASFFKIFSSMRIRDDLQGGISTFYAELLRIKDVIEYQKTNNPLIVFIDEVFKGTNANDRIKGAVALIKKINKPNVILFLTTHDFELCENKDINITNYHFSEYYENETIHFDYKLKDGRCKTTNAKYLMRLAGIITEEVE